jgi:hypothetical protein
MWEFVQLIRLLIQRADVTPHLQQLCNHLREFLSPDAGVDRAGCSTLPCFAHSDVRVCWTIESWGPGLAPIKSHTAVGRFERTDVLVNYAGCLQTLPLQVYLDLPPRLAHAARNAARNFSRPATENTAVLLDDPAPSAYSIVARW